MPESAQTEKRRRAYQKGLWAEDAACAYLEKKGYQILERRFKTAFGEIDIIARHKNTLVFAEVKARLSADDGVYAVNARSQKRIEQAALYFLTQKPESMEMDMRFDVLTVQAKENNDCVGFSIQHLDNAWVSVS